METTNKKQIDLLKREWKFMEKELIKFITPSDATGKTVEIILNHPETPFSGGMTAIIFTDNTILFLDDHHFYDDIQLFDIYGHRNPLLDFLVNEDVITVDKIEPIIKKIEEWRKVADREKLEERIAQKTKELEELKNKL